MVSFQICYLLNFLIGKRFPLPAMLCHSPPWITNPTPHARPSCSINLTAEKIRIVDCFSGEFILFYLLNFLNGYWYPYLPSSAPPSMNFKLHAPCWALLWHQSNSKKIRHLLKWWILDFFICSTISVDMGSPNLLSSPPYDLQTQCPCRALLWWWVEKLEATDDGGGDVSKRWEGIELFLCFLLRIDYKIELMLLFSIIWS